MREGHAPSGPVPVPVLVTGAAQEAAGGLVMIQCEVRVREEEVVSGVA